MKSKKIPVDINAKSLKDSQSEIKEIADKLENNETNLENSIDLYNRMVQLNNHIHVKFKQKADEIKKYTLKKNKKN
tara:strand:- start:236 stop:463 length:228 start_codon:yes stop_codon:yes gene_type:complete